MSSISEVLSIIDCSSPTVPTAGVMLFVVRVGNDLVAGLMMLASQEFLQGNDTGDQESDLGKEDGLGGSEGNDSEEQGNESHDLQLGDSEKRDELL